MAPGKNLFAPATKTNSRVTSSRVFSHPTEVAGRSSARLLLLVPFVGVLWAPSFETVSPLLGGLPFSVIYSLLWVVVSAAVVYTVYRAEN
jgi:hypothetical protein